MSIKQVIVVRKLYTDVNGGMRKLRTGKIAAQVAHASMKVFFDQMQEVGDDRYEIGPGEGWDWEVVCKWIEGSFTKVVLGCDSEGELLALVERTKAMNLPHALIIDSGLTEFHGVPTMTCLAIGPAQAYLIDQITGHLQLL